MGEVRVKFDVNTQFRQTFGIVANFPVYSLGDKKPETPLPLNKSQILPNGFRVYDRYSFQPIGLNSEEAIQRNQEVVASVAALPGETILDISNDVDIVSTKLIGINGTVKELISQGDWQISFKGFIVNYEADRYPADQVEAFYQNFYKFGKSYLILAQYSDIFNRLGIEKVVVTSLKLPAMAGVTNYQPYELTCVSDLPDEIYNQFVV
jgi:hypothetical protein